MLVGWARLRCPVGEKLRRRAELEDIAFLMNRLPVLVSITGLKRNRAIANTATWKLPRASVN
jgi:hypothetical protein